MNGNCQIVVKLDPHKKVVGEDIREERQEIKDHRYYGNMPLHNGHSVWMMDKEGEITKVDFKSTKIETLTTGKEARFKNKVRHQVATNPENLYTTALNKKNALKKFKKRLLQQQLWLEHQAIANRQKKA